MEPRSATHPRTGPSFFASAVIALSIAPLQAQEAQRWNVPVYIEYDRQVSILTLARAQKVASDILASANVRLTWRSGSHSQDKHAIPSDCSALQDAPVTIAIDFTPPRQFHSQSTETLAYTFPYAPGGARIHVFYERLSPMYRNSPRLGGIVLGYVLAHEISHVLQRIDRHSASGVMKARWTSNNYVDMQTDSLRFADEDVLLIGMGLESWRRLACPARIAPAPAAITAHAALP